jgi:hypothetical protein
VRSALLSGDGEEMLLTMTDSSYALMPSTGGAPTPARGLLPTDSPFAWTSGRQIVVASGNVPVTITLVDPVSGRRTTVMTMAPPDRAGVTGVSPLQWIDDGKGYVYVYFRELSKLFVVTGVGQ